MNVTNTTAGTKLFLAGPPDVVDLTTRLGGEMLALAGVAADRADEVARISRALDDFDLGAGRKLADALAPAVCG